MVNFIEIEMIAKNINIIINMTSEKIDDDPYSKEVIDTINSLISAFVHLNNEMNLVFLQYPKSNLNEDMNEIANNFEELIKCYESRESILIKDIFMNKLVLKFNVLYKNLSEFFSNITGVKKIIVIGVNKLSNKIGSLIDKGKYEIIAFISDDVELRGKWLNGIPIHGSEESKWIKYDYVISASNSNWHLQENNSINIYDYIKRYYDYEIYRAYDYYVKCKGSLDSFVTGISYAEVAINTQQLPYNIINLAVSSQDLFYDYEWAKMVLNNNEIAKNIKFAIIGLSYYSFEYDLSKSNFKDRVYMYYSIFKTCHSHPYYDEIIKSYNKFHKVASKIFKRDYMDSIYSLLKENSDSLWESLVSGVMDEEVIERDKWMVEKDCDKNYPLTVEENTMILKKYLSLLKSKEIKPIVVICPVSKHYYSKFSPRIKAEFIDIMNKIKNEFDIEVLDYFESKEFTDQDFYNVSHLNKDGAKKFTKLLNDSIKI
ncbi:hypothetical protein CSC2_15020 [Clostridium zeae]|uniref:Uncharacterized protein n=1 Tax=Clostridium zeae TaxID=2759022 RepID=A0ABQ1E872_9CLOT|nr:hypothetical protein [Clostridium zeae]GFZ30976.1 hypothetical protein CSC2_15020 [Clostridium zeae]